MMGLANAASLATETPCDGELRWEHMRIRLVDSIMTVTLDHPPANALTRSMFDAVDRAIALLEDDAVRVVIVTGAGTAFSIGADVRGILGTDAVLEQGRRSQRQLEQLELAAKPIIAAINGHCLGGGLELALACHLRIASTRAKLGLPEVSLGLLPGMGGTHRLPRLVGRARAHEMILTGRMVKADEAQQIGLVNWVVPPEEVLPAAERLARRIAAKSPAAVRAAMRCLNTGLDPASASAEVMEMECFEQLAETPEVRRTLQALELDFGERRAP
jgi:enoyl-CoA hydratase